MPEVFADTGYWIAMHNPGDEWHDIARSVTNRLRDGTIVTNEMVLVEFLNFCSRQGAAGRRQAATTVDRLWKSENTVVVPQTSDQLRLAVQRYVERPDQRWSVTDCASFIVMEQRGITEALAYDRDFEQAGFQVLLRAG